MANLFLVVDPDPTRRAEVAAEAASRLPLLPGLADGAMDAGDVAVRWAAAPRAPISRLVDADGATLLVGTALEETGAVDAAGLRSRWRGDPARPAAFDGFHLGIDVDAEGAVSVGVDILGWFPLYWWHDGSVLLVGTSPELFSLHPCFRAELDPRALAGVLLVNCLVGGRALLRGVRRLRQGHQLRWRRGDAPRETLQWEPEAEWDGADLTFATYQEWLDAALEDVLRRHLRGHARCGILLSGGLDSRMIAGYLDRMGVGMDALTFGRAGDTELRCARSVARALGISHQVRELEPTAIVESSWRTARWEHLANGFSTTALWEHAQVLGTLPDRLVIGHGVDTVLFALTQWTSEVVREGRYPFEAAFALRNKWGLPADMVARLLAPLGGADATSEAMRELRAEFESLDAVDFRRYWRFALATRVRYHLGSAAWHVSFGSWPVSLVLDRALLRVVTAMPIAALSERRMQTELVRRKFPRLAALPLDRNSDDDTPLIMTARAHLRAALRARLAPARRWLGPGRERRYYYRTFDFDGDGWRRARETAEPYRAGCDGLVDRATLDALLPPPGQQLRVTDAIIGSSGPKLLLGLVMWLATREFRSLPGTLPSPSLNAAATFVR